MRYCTVFQFLQVLELPPRSSVLLVYYFSYHNIRVNCFNQQLQAWLFSRKGLASMKANWVSFLSTAQISALFNPFPPSLHFSPARIFPGLLLPWHSHPSLQRFLHSKHKNLFALKRSGKPQILACVVYDNQGQTCFQKFFFLIIKTTANFKSSWCFRLKLVSCRHGLLFRKHMCCKNL